MIENTCWTVNVMCCKEQCNAHMYSRGSDVFHFTYIVRNIVIVSIFGLFCLLIKSSLTGTLWVKVGFITFVNTGERALSEHLCYLSLNLIGTNCLSSRSNRSIVEDIRQGEGKIYGAELLKDLLKLLPDAEEVCVFECLCGF